MFAERQRLSPSPAGIEVSGQTLHFGVVDQSALPIGSIVKVPTGAPWIHHSAVTITTAAESHSDVTKYSQNSGRLGIPSTIGKIGKTILCTIGPSASAAVRSIHTRCWTKSRRCAARTAFAKKKTKLREKIAMNSFSETGRIGIACGSTSPLMARIKPAATRTDTGSLHCNSAIKGNLSPEQRFNLMFPMRNPIQDTSTRPLIPPIHWSVVLAALSHRSNLPASGFPAAK